jgi:hypothetical protein
MTESDLTDADVFEGLSDVAVAALESVPIRMRENGFALSAWRLSVQAGQGQGVIFLVQMPGGGALFRGDGIFLGWPQARLEAAYRRLLPSGGDPDPDPGQAG